MDVCLSNALENLQLTSPKIQKDIVSAIAFETLDVIMRDIGVRLFSILVDESRDVSVKEQMSVVLRYVNQKGQDYIDHLFSRFNLSISSLRGQGYDGASNMRDEYNGLKSLILKENPSAFYIHCFAHQLQLALVAVASKHAEIETFFTLVNKVVNVVGGSAKQCDLLREKKRLEVVESLNLVDVVEMIATDDTSCGNLHLMKKVLGISDELSKSLQRRDQDIVNAMKLVKISKERLQATRDNEWESFLRTVSCFCERYNIDVPNMDDMFIPLGRSQRNTQEISNLHHFRVDFFYAIIDMQIQELNDRFFEVNSDLLLCVACLCPDNSFSAFNKDKLIQLCEYYPKDFKPIEILAFEEQIQTYIIDMRSHKDFEGLQGLNDLAETLVVTKKHEVYPLVYRLVTLALILPVATATVERVFSAMKIVKNRLRNRMGDQWLSDSLVAYIESDVLDNIDNDVIIQRFQSMKTRRLQL
ncbi:zinc finger MYM-type protein 1-like [Olea europaea var. sylvestris]|uniref:zinc finger MYM-type protein 1-like n=1 Tax=Olea europaea var. sylvestris TaxID=158386 RepID=UPI000C1D4729|nr:zinc finger MYM-type protein 1-like [Olea europaea var. sylvestris]